MAVQPQTVVSVVYSGICKDYYGLDEQETHPFDCTGNPTSVGPLWRRWKRFFEFFYQGQGHHKGYTKTSPTFALRWTGFTGHFRYAE